MTAAALDPSAPLCPCGARGCSFPRYHAAVLGPRKRRWFHRR